MSDPFSPRFQLRNENAKAECTYTEKSLKNLKFSCIFFPVVILCLSEIPLLGSSGSESVVLS